MVKWKRIDSYHVITILASLNFSCPTLFAYSLFRRFSQEYTTRGGQLKFRLHFGDQVVGKVELVVNEFQCTVMSGQEYTVNIASH